VAAAHEEMAEEFIDRLFRPVRMRRFSRWFPGESSTEVAAQLELRYRGYDRQGTQAHLLV